MPRRVDPRMHQKPLTMHELSSCLPRRSWGEGG